MAVTIPICERVVLSGTATNALVIAAMHAWLVANPGQFTIQNAVGTPVTSFTLLHSSGWQLNYRLSGGQILVIIAPQGGITDSATPGTPPNGMPEAVVFPALTGVGDRVNFAQYGDAILVAVQSSANNSYPYCTHDGRVLDSLEPFDTRFIGLGHFSFLFGAGTGNTSNTMFSGTANTTQRLSKIRTLAGTWVSPGTIYTSFGVAQSARGRFCPIIVTGGTSEQQPSATNTPPAAVCAYCRVDTAAALAPLNVVPSDVTDQGMLSINETTGTTRFRMVWDKNVTP